MDDLEERVQQFAQMKLPGQPIGMHMGTAYLVNDLWREVVRLRKANGELVDSLATMATKAIDLVGGR